MELKGKDSSGTGNTSDGLEEGYLMVSKKSFENLRGNGSMEASSLLKFNLLFLLVYRLFL
jgi:hypothetical protein